MRRFFSVFLSIVFFPSIVFFLSPSFVFAFASKSEASSKFSWKSSADGKVRIWTDDNRTFLWRGSEIEGVADGVGVIQFVGGGISFEGAKFSYGARESSFVELGGTGDKYAGEGIIKGNQFVPDGFGVLLKSNGNVYVGDFKKGKIHGKASRIFKGNLLYRGDFKSNLFHGQGKFFKDGKLSYSGRFLNGVQEGEGSEFRGGFEFSGKFVNGLKEGLFSIVGHGISREIFFKGGEPDLSSAMVTYDGGVVWHGALDSRLNPKGDGIISYSNGDVYEGGVEWNRRNGFGSFTSGSFSYDGEWVNDFCTGFGEAVFSEGWFYSGSWKENVFDGRGVLVAGDFKYSGEWKDGKKDGFGTLLLADSRFDGYFKDDRINGEGVMLYANGDFYDGEWKDSRREGFGEYAWADGSFYSGRWEDDLQSGRGEYYLSNGDIYEGDFYDGKYWGKGVFSYSSGARYEGSFKDNKKEGFGYYKFSDGSSYDGNFKDDVIDGRGKFKFKDGSFYDGDFKNGKIEGKGSLHVPSEGGYVVLSSSFWNGSVLPQSGSMLFPNGDEFVGKLWNGKPTADGVWRKKGKKTLSEDAFSFYKAHEETIKSVVSTTQLVLAGVSIAGDVVAVVAAVPCPPAAGIALAVSKIADIANASISGLNIVVGTGVMAREVADARAMGDVEGEKSIKKEYFKEQAWNVADVALTFGSAAFKAAKAGKAVNAGRKVSKVGGKVISGADSSKRILGKAKAVNLKKLNSKLTSIKGKGKIKLSKSDIEWIMKDPKVNLRATVRAKTGAKSFGEGFQEFFIRLSDGDKSQVKTLMDVPEIKKVVNQAIRGGGGKHEWLMTKNFTDFLTNSKWGKDGQKAAIALTELVQDTKTVAFKNGGTHFDKMNSGKFHQGLSKVIESSDNVDDLLVDVKKYAEGALTKESFEEFCEIFERCFGRM